MWTSIKKQLLLKFYDAVLFETGEKQARVAGIIVNPNPYEDAYRYQTDSATFFRLAEQNLFCTESAVYLCKRLIVEVLGIFLAGFSAASSLLLLYLSVSYFTDPAGAVSELARFADIEALDRLFDMFLLFSGVCGGFFMFFRLTNRSPGYRFNRKMKLLLNLSGKV